MRLFQLQRISAIALLVFLTIHMMVLHYPPFQIDFARILERMADPLWKVLDIAFLFFVLIHALSGTYAVLTDFDSVSRARKVLAVGASIIGVAAFFYGAATILAFRPPV